MAPPNPMTPIGSITTMGDMIRRILEDVNEPVTPKNQNQIANYINDAIESIWMSMLLASLSRFTKGPVNQVFPSGKTSFDLVSVPDPTTALSVSAIAGGGTFVGTVYFSYCLVTDSGSTTKISPLTAQALGAGQVARILSPALDSTWGDHIIGYYIFAGLNADGSDQGQQTPLVPIGQLWISPPTGIVPLPNTNPVPQFNTTADNVFDIIRMDVQNVDTTWTSWLQSNVGSAWFTSFQKMVSTSTTFLPYVYDFIADRQIEVRPALGTTLTGAYFYTTRPRRLRFMQSRFPYPQFAGIVEFVHDYTLSKFTLGIYEYDASDRWKDFSKDVRGKVTMETSQANFNQNTTVKPFMR